MDLLELSFFDKILNRILEKYKSRLHQTGKVVSKKTINSLDKNIISDESNIELKITAAKSLQYIERGRRKGAKLPVKKVNGKFQLVDNLAEWVKLVNFTGSHYLLARKKSREGTPPTIITEFVIDELLDDIKKEIALFYKDFFLKKVILSTQHSFKQFT